MDTYVIYSLSQLNDKNENIRQSGILAVFHTNKDVSTDEFKNVISSALEQNMSQIPKDLKINVIDNAYLEGSYFYCDFMCYFSCQSVLVNLVDETPTETLTEYAAKYGWKQADEKDKDILFFNEKGQTIRGDWGLIDNEREYFYSLYNAEGYAISSGEDTDLYEAIKDFSEWEDEDK